MNNELIDTIKKEAKDKNVTKRTLNNWLKKMESEDMRSKRIADLHLVYGMTLKESREKLGLSCSRVSKLIYLTTGIKINIATIQAYEYNTDKKFRLTKKRTAVSQFYKERLSHLFQGADR